MVILINTKNFMKDIYCLVGCIFLFVFGSMVPGMKLFSFVLTLLSGGLVASNFYKDKWKTLFVNLGLYSRADKKLPKLINKSKNEIGDRYIFTIPNGLCLKDFEECKTEIETFIKKPVKMGLTSNFNLMIQVFDVEYKSVYKPNYDV